MSDRIVLLVSIGASVVALAVLYSALGVFA